jgi:cysteine desulfurase / selenocysteine lyase
MAQSMAPALDVETIRADFPALQQLVHGRPLVYLDNAATTQKPRAVIDAVAGYYARDNANVHRGVHELSERATAAYEGAREAVRAFVNAASTSEVVFTRNATEAINLVARAWGDAHVRAGDEVLITAMEHHSNIVPWQQLCRRVGATLRAVPIDDRGQLRMDDVHRLLTERTKMVAVVQVSNALGTVNPVAEIVSAARHVGAAVLVDGSQAVAHLPTDVQRLGADFFVFTGHKIFGPTGIGVLWGREAVLEATPPFLGGGDMIRTVTLDESTWNDLPYKFEAGTPNIAGAVGLHRALAFVGDLGFERVAAHETALLEAATAGVASIAGAHVIGTAAQKVGVLSFVVDGVHPHDIGTIVDRDGVAIRTGHHCAQPVMDRFGIPATARASFAVYNTMADVEALIRSLHRVRRVMG